MVSSLRTGSNESKPAIRLAEESLPILVSSTRRCNTSANVLIVGFAHEGDKKRARILRAKRRHEPSSTARLDVKPTLFKHVFPAFSSWLTAET